jgi:hypothetical protein
MIEAAQWSTARNAVARRVKDKGCLLGVIRRYLDACKVDRNEAVLVLGLGRRTLTFSRPAASNALCYPILICQDSRLTQKTSIFPITAITLFLRSLFCTTVGAHIRQSGKWYGFNGGMCSFSSRMIPGLSGSRASKPFFSLRSCGSSCPRLFGGRHAKWIDRKLHLSVDAT